MKRLVPLLIPALLACAAAPRPGTPDGRPEPPAKADTMPVVLHAGDVPPGAIELLAESEADSCSICAREKREKAFRVLAERFPPGAVVASGDTVLFRLLPDGENELVLGAAPPDRPALTYRFHTTSRHLVGIDPADFTSPAVAESLLAAPEGASFRGTLRVVPYEYGDGPSFLFSDAEERVVVMCRIETWTRD